MTAPVLASDWPKARFTVAQIWALIEKGVLPEDTKFELLDGEVIPMSPKGPLHEEARLAVMAWVRSLSANLAVLAETTLYLDDSSFVEPDYVVFDASLRIKDLSPDKVLLAIEVADDSWKYDTTDKAERYAAHGVQEYWAINAKTLGIRIHRGPGADGWADVREAKSGETVSPLCAPDAAFTL